MNPLDIDSVAVAKRLRRRIEYKVEVPVVSRFPPLEEPPPTCSKCKLEVDVLKCQHTGRGAQATFKCNLCNTKHVTLVKEFGTFPMDGFETLPEDSQIEFWRSKAVGAKAVKRLVLDQVLKRLIERNESNWSGTRQPISFYINNGATEQEVKDIIAMAPSMDHTIYKKTYKVALLTISHKTIEEQAQQQLWEMTEKTKMNKHK